MSLIGQPLDALDSPQLLLDLDVLDANLRLMQDACRQRGLGVARSLQVAQVRRTGEVSRGARCAPASCARKLNEAEVLADAGIDDIFIANEIVGSLKLARLAQPGEAGAGCASVSTMPATSPRWAAAARRKASPSKCWSRWTSA